MSAKSLRRDADDLDREYAMLIDGEWVGAGSGRTFRCVDPYTERSWGQVPEADASDVDRAVRAARRAFDRDGWPQQPAAQRAALLRRLAQLIEAHADALTYQQIRENGKLVSEMRPGSDALARACYYFAGLAETLSGQTLPRSQGFSISTVREPLGVVAAVTPWNSPLMLLAWKLFPALAAGNTVVVKPSEITPTSTLELARLVAEAGFPRGVVNVVTGFGDPAGAALIRHPGVDKIAFTGSTATGRAVARAAAERCARISLELGGKSPNIIFADANLGAAIDGAVAGIFAATGQTCVAGSRVLVERGIYDEAADRLVRRARELKAGDPLDRTSELGPLASRAQLTKVQSYFEIARDEGLERLTGGRRMDRTGFFVEPTVYGRVGNDCRVAREEIFGPIAALIPFADEEQAVAIANDTPFGLAAGVWTEDLRRAHRIVSRLRAGTVWVNNYRQIGYGAPFGGVRQSGIGRELGPEALHEYTEVKSVWIDTR
ncbi:MAG TPA: aldehyde dehydrogenase family protein [Steroidobacteraceae bacterium]|nr:aldehyde dehydrogenase family protein [Steroidobacteraceae bacterium]